MGTHCERCGEANPGDARFCKSCGAPLAVASPLAADDPLLDQVVLERYRIRHLIGEGGMGRVYAAEQRVGTTVRRVAVKTLRAQLSADPQIVKRFYREAETIVRLTHPNIISFFDFGALADGTLVIVMEHIEGESLAAVLTRGPLSTQRVDAILAQVCSALAEAHGIGIVHRDLKPDNILLTTRGGQADFVKVLDFGIAKISAQEHEVTTKLTQQGMIVGTPPYMSPEQFSGDVVDARSDVYSLGVIAYEMHTGRLPFEARTPWEWASKHLTAEPEQLRVDVQTGISKQRAQAIRRALSKTPDGRPSSVEMFLDELRSGESGAARPAAPAAYATAPLAAAPDDPNRESSEAITISGLSKQRGAWTWVAAGAMALVAIAAVAMVGKSSSERAELRAPPAPVVLAKAHETPAIAVKPPTDEPAAATPDPVPERIGVSSSSSPRASGRKAPYRSSDSQATPEPRGSATRTPDPSALDDERSARSAHGPDSPKTGLALPANPAATPTTASAPNPKQSASVEPKSEPAHPAPAKAPVTPPDLTERVNKANAEAVRRPEVAVGMYRAAVSRYGVEHPALVALAGTVRRESDRRIKELVGNDRCAQAQALFRALTSAGLAGTAATSFSSHCPAP